MSHKLVLFDIDGTILLTAGAGRRAITAALGEAIGDHAAFERIRFDGKTDPQIIAELLTAAGHHPPHNAGRVRTLCERYVALLERELQVTIGTRLMPGFPAILDRLEAHDGVVLGLLTGNLARGAALKLRAAGIDPARFRIGAFGSDAADRPELPAIAAQRAAPLFGRTPEGSDVVIIGDTPADIACGGNIGARAVGVATGSFTAAELAACHPHAVFEDLADTGRVLDAILA
ncbi:MAG TPA: HAD hydrolase-like protein [Gemmatimonadales bacterium]|nr:HAD hydrolase-like protein [Gemmatimonadales bacterium]